MTSPTTRTRAPPSRSRGTASGAEADTVVSLTDSDIGWEFGWVGIRTSNRVVIDAQFGHRFRFVKVTAVENERRLQHRFQVQEVWALELFPFCDDHQRVCACERFVLRAREV